MPPKNRNKKSGKGKPSAEVDALSTEEMSKDQLEEHVVRLREELDREREERSYFQLERDKIRGLWEISRRRLEEAEAELRDSVRQRDEAAERHRVEITVYKQKLKHVLSEQHNTVCEMKTDAVSSSSLVRDRNAGLELDLQRQLRDLQAAGEQKMLQEHGAAKELQLKHQAELMRLGNEYERQIYELEMSFHQRAHSLMQAEDRKRRAAVSEVEQRMKSHMESLMEEHDRILRKGEEYFSQIQRNQQEELDRWKGELKKLLNQKLRWEKKISAAQQENQRLKTTLQEVQQKLPELHRRLQEHQHSKHRMEEYRAQQKLVDQELRDLTVEHELLLQAFQKVQQERDELLRRQTQSILDIQQRSGLKKILLQRKLEALSQTLEKKEAQLSAALSVCSVEPTARSNAANKLQEILESKQTAMEALQLDLDQGAQLLRPLQDDVEVAVVPPLLSPSRPAEPVREEPGPDRW
ncbi:dynein regulatory complex subunit 4-like isoform X1 [Gambusia affinis]|uniref:dynein regulatory complex subunit 4-like isoform X1 n=1 Tax=Gambusia affinis TaxID=33528 RepID=UPI001CDD30DC|nr:dynein regulatory complex subunit 4-like isoform X1 [Gambusia affinis]